MIALAPDGAELPGLVAGFRARGGRLLGLCGAPGAGKSTLADRIAALVPGAVVVPMDGFHLADVELVRRGLRERKGAPETFDVAGYAALLARVSAREALVMAPEFSRVVEQPVAGAIAVAGSAPLVVTEGNYLLCDGWEAVRGWVDEVWHLRLSEQARVPRLVARHVEFGKEPSAAREWVGRVDGPNAALVESVASRADLVLDVSALGASTPGVSP